MEDSYLSALRSEIESQYEACPTGCGSSFGELLCWEIHTNQKTFIALAEKWGISLPTLGDLIKDHCDRLQNPPHVRHACKGDTPTTSNGGHDMNEPTNYEEWLKKYDPMLRRTAVKFGGSFWRDDLYQNLLLKLWLASEKYGKDFPFIASACVRSVVSDHLRFLKKNLYLSLDPDFEIACEKSFSYDWETVFDVGHRTENLTAVRFMRSVLNPDRNQLQREEETGGFSWNQVFRTVGLKKKDMQEAFSQLRSTLISLTDTAEPFYSEEA